MKTYHLNCLGPRTHKFTTQAPDYKTARDEAARHYAEVFMRKQFRMESRPYVKEVRLISEDDECGNYYVAVARSDHPRRILPAEITTTITIQPLMEGGS